MDEATSSGLSRDRLLSWATKLSLPNYGETTELRSRVERALAASYDAWEFFECENCGFSRPCVEELAECPGCGVRSAPSGGQKLEQQTATSRPKRSATLKAKDEKREDEKADARADVTAREQKAAKKLAELEGRIDELKASSGRLEWDIGKHLLEIHGTDLWQVSGGFKSFIDYVEKRFEFTRQTARSYMRIAETFQREEASELPLGTMHLLSKVPDEEERRELVERAKKEKPSFRDLAAEVKTKREEAGLNTARAGMEDTVHIAARIKIGDVVGEGSWSQTKGKNPKRRAHFHVGGALLELEDLGEEGFVVRLKKGD